MSARRVPLNAFESYMQQMNPEVLKKLHTDLEKQMKTPVHSDPEVSQIVKDALGNVGMTTNATTVPYALETPAYNVWPLVTPLRNTLARRVVGGTGNHYKLITKIDAAEDLGFVPEMSNTNNGRAGFITWDEKDGLATFKKLGLDNFVSIEAQIGARSVIDGANFNNAEVAQLMALHGVMMREEKAYLFANAAALTAAALGTPSLTYSAAGEPAIVQAPASAGGLTASTHYYFKVSALTGVGYRKGSTGNSTGVSGNDAPFETNGSTELNAQTAASGAGSTSATFGWNSVKGAFCYNVYVGTSTNTEQYQATVFVNRYTCITATPTSTNVPNLADQTADSNAFEGIIKQIATATANGSYWASLGGAKLTGDSTSGILEFDTMFRTMFKSRQVGIDTLWMSADQRFEADQIITGSGIGPLMRIDLTNGQQNITGGITSQGMWNRYTGKMVQFKTHPFLPPGTIFGTCSTLGEYYAASNLPNPVEVLLGFDYMRFEFARTGLGDQFGTYIYGAPVLRVPFALSVLQSVG